MVARHGDNGSGSFMNSVALETEILYIVSDTPLVYTEAKCRSIEWGDDGGAS